MQGRGLLTAYGLLRRSHQLLSRHIQQPTVGGVRKRLGLHHPSPTALTTKNLSQRYVLRPVTLSTPSKPRLPQDRRERDDVFYGLSFI